MSGELPGLASLGELAGRTVLLRADLNVPLVAGEVGDDARLRASLPTLSRLTGAGARVVVLAHLGRPRGPFAADLSLAPVARRLGSLTSAPVRFVPALTGEPVRAAVAELADGEVLVLENLRFSPAETSKDDAERGEFAAALASLADAYVDDAFGAVHRKHASVYDLPGLLPHAAGELVVLEVSVLARLVEDASRPYVVLLGGAKVSDKLGVISALLSRVSALLVGGGMCFTFLAALGGSVGDSLLEPAHLSACLEFLALAERRGVPLLLPTDVLAAPGPSGPLEVVPAGAIPEGLRGLDIGPDTVESFSAALRGARTVFWNGPMGVFENPAFRSGTAALAHAVAGVHAAGGLAVVGGGDSAAAVHALGIPDESFSHVSTGGGASLEYLEGRTLPGLEALVG